MTNATPKFKIRTYDLRTYDVWGNKKDGFEVNDVFTRQRGIEIRCGRETFNAGTSMEFHTWNPTDRQLSRAAGVRGCTWDGDDLTAFATAKNGMPVCELVLVDDSI